MSHFIVLYKSVLFFFPEPCRPAGLNLGAVSTLRVTTLSSTHCLLRTKHNCRYRLLQTRSFKRQF